MATARTILLEQLTKLASNFVATQKSTWDHNAWTDFLSLVQQKGIALSEEMQSLCVNLPSGHAFNEIT